MQMLDFWRCVLFPSFIQRANLVVWGVISTGVALSILFSVGVPGISPLLTHPKIWNSTIDYGAEIKWLDKKKCKLF